MFNLNSNQYVFALNTGIPVRLIARYNSRQNKTGYSGPQLFFSYREYHSTDVNAASLPRLVCYVKGLQNIAPHSLWAFAKSETEAGSLFNSFAIFLSRLMNELPAGRHGNRHLLKLKESLEKLFQKMEKEYEDKNKDIKDCTFINQILTVAASTASTCSDRIKLGYLFMLETTAIAHITDITEKKKD